MRARSSPDSAVMAPPSGIKTAAKPSSRTQYCLIENILLLYFINIISIIVITSSSSGAYGEGRGVHRVLVGKPEGKRPLGRPRRRWEDNIKMDLQGVGGGGDWMELVRIGTGGGHL